MAVIKEVTYSGQGGVSTLTGDIRLETGSGRLVIYDPQTQRELNVVDRTGYLFSDATDRRIKIGAAPNDGRVGVWVSDVGDDVIELLEQ